MGGREMKSISEANELWYREEFSGVMVRFTVDWIHAGIVHGRSYRGAFVRVPIGKTMRHLP